MSSLDSRLERVADIERKLARRPAGYTTFSLQNDCHMIAVPTHVGVNRLRMLGRNGCG